MKNIGLSRINQTACASIVALGSSIEEKKRFFYRMGLSVALDISH